MDLIKIDVIDTKTFQAGVDRMPDVFLGGTLLVGSGTRWIKHFRRNDDLFPAYAELFQRLTEDLFTLALGI